MQFMAAKAVLPSPMSQEAEQRGSLHFDRAFDSAGQPRRNHLLVIGVDEYEHFRPLNNAVNDAKKVKQILTELYDFEVVDEFPPLYNSDATLVGLSDTFKRLAAYFKKPGQAYKDNLLIYFAGHGEWDDDVETGYWLPSDAQKHKIGTYLSNASLIEYLKAIRTHHTLVLTDSCFAGSLILQNETRGDRKESKRSRYVMASGLEDEKVDDGPKGAHSPFARSIIGFLENYQGIELRLNQLEDHIDKYFRDNRIPQTPIFAPLNLPDNQHGEWVFRKKVSATQPQPPSDELILPPVQPALDTFTEKEEPLPIAASEEVILFEMAKRLKKPEIFLSSFSAEKYAQRSGIPYHDMILIKGGKFEMGDVMGDHVNDDEKPVHEVKLNDFYIGKYAVTFDQYDTYCESRRKAKPSDMGWGRADRPVINVSWKDAQEYCEWLKEQTGQPWRLPTEAEWEFAARERGRKVRFGNGQDIADPSQMNFDARQSYQESYSVVGKYEGKTVPVGSLSKNRLGLYNMSGNVWEWCGDWYDKQEYIDYRPFSPPENPEGPKTGTKRVYRGGSWSSSPADCRASDRNAYDPNYRSNTLGFRVARSL